MILTGADAREVAPGVVLDFDAEGNLVGIDIDRANHIADLSHLEARALPVVRPAASQRQALASTQSRPVTPTARPRPRPYPAVKTRTPSVR